MTLTIDYYGEASLLRKLVARLKVKRRQGFAAVGVTKGFKKEKAWMYW